jgi:hypothetical protein
MLGLMSERTFRAVVASVLVGALALGVVVAAVVLAPRSNQPRPTPSAVPSPAATPVTTTAPTPIAGPVFAAPEVVSVGLIQRGAISGPTLVLRFVEPSVDAIPNAPGSFRVTLTDAANDGSTVSFTGTPTIGAPGSLGATTEFSAPNVLLISIVASDNVEVEPITITGLGIRATSTAAIGPIRAELDAFTGSLATGAPSNVLPSPGSVIASQ